MSNSFGIKRNLTMLTDFYEFTMSNGFLENHQFPMAASLPYWRAWNNYWIM